MCPNCRLPEAHNCNTRVVQKLSKNKTLCENCGKEIKNLPYICRRCGGKFCEICRLPENHKCVPKIIPPVPPPLPPTPPPIPPRPPVQPPPDPLPKKPRKTRKTPKHKNNKGIYIFTIILVIIGGFIITQTSIIDNIESNFSRPNIEISTLEQSIHNKVNEQRQVMGQKPLILDSKLSDIARKHSQDMAENNYFSHYNSQGEGPTERAARVGYICQKRVGNSIQSGIAENCHLNNLYSSITTVNGIPIYDWNTAEQIALSTVNGWMNSPGHRSNLLNSGYDYEGIGIAISSDDKVYITQDFC